MFYGSGGLAQLVEQRTLNISGLEELPPLLTLLVENHQNKF